MEQITPGCLWSGIRNGPGQLEQRNQSSSATIDDGRAGTAVLKQQRQRIMQAKQILTTGEIAKYCGVNFRTVIRWIERGRLRAYQLPGRGDNRVTVEDFIDFLKENHMPIPDDFAQRERRVLIVESDPTLARQVESTLQQSGYMTSIAADGFAAGSMLGTFRPSVMLLDLRIPGLSADDVVTFIRRASGQERIKVVIVSNETTESRPMSGADAYLLRPFSNEELVEKVNGLLEASFA